MIEIITTSDGSHSLLNTDLNETYHSHHGARQESVHVFINKGLEHWIELNPSKKTINILEVGFGTGLNALLTLQHATSSAIQYSYTSIESFPLEKDIWSKLNYSNTDKSVGHFSKLHEAPWNESQHILPNFKLLKLKTTLQEVNLQTTSFDVIYFDAFAPSKQPEMWELPLLQKVAQAMDHGSFFVTYCAKGQLKRDLKSLGLQVETLPGPPGKKEMVRALKFE